MKRALTVLIGIILISWSVSVWGHYPEGLTFLAFQWPSGQEPLIDGDVGEWDIVPDQYVLNTTQYATKGIFEEMIGSDLPDLPDWISAYGISFVWTGWSASENALYIATRTFDDDHTLFNFHKFPHPAFMWMGDDFEIMIDADHSGGVFGSKKWESWDWQEGTWEIKREYWDNFGSQAIWYLTAWPVPVPLFAFTAASWVCEPPWAQGGWDYDERVVPEKLTGYELRTFGALRVKGWLSEEQMASWKVITYELKLIPFDRIDWRGPDQSVIHRLREEEIVGLNYAFTCGTYDAGNTEYSISGGYMLLSSRSVITSDSMMDGSHFSDFLLAPLEEQVFETGVQGSTWGRIKASFGERTAN